MEYLTIKDLNFQYAGRQEQALKNVNVTIKSGEILFLCGATGSGKSTLLKLLKPQIKPVGTQTGTILLKQVALKDCPEIDTASQIGWIGPNPDAQFVTEHVWDELAFGLENLGLTASEITNRIGELVTFLGITQLMDKKVSELSGGEKQLIHLAAVLAMRPKLVLLDEPTAQLDPQATQTVMNMLLRLNRELGVTLIIAEHQLTGFLKEVDHILLLDQGAISLLATPRTLIQHLTKQQVAHQRFMEELPAAIQLYARSQNNQTQVAWPPLTVVEGKIFLERVVQKAQREVIFTTKKESPRNAVSAIQLSDGWFRYHKDDQDVFVGTSLQVQQGEIMTIVGANGSGKTTLLKIVAGIASCYTGKLLFFGKPPKKSIEKVAYLPQNPHLLFLKETIVEDYHYYLSINGYSGEAAAEKIHRMIERLHLEDCLTKHPLDLSEGQLQQAALGKLLLGEPDILLLDEPTKGLDRYMVRQTIYLLRNLSGEGKTILCATHNLDFAAEVSDRCSLCFDHQLLLPETSHSFFAHHQFYTTEASRIASEWSSNVITIAELLDFCHQLEELK